MVMPLTSDRPVHKSDADRTTHQSLIRLFALAQLLSDPKLRDQSAPANSEPDLYEQEQKDSTVFQKARRKGF